MDGWTDGYTVAFIINPSEDNPLQLFSLCLVSTLLQNLQSPFYIIRPLSGERNHARHYTRSKKTRETKDSMDGQHGRIDRLKTY